MKVKKEFKNDPVVKIALHLSKFPEQELNEQELYIIEYYKEFLCNKSE